MRERKKEWSKPELIVLVRSKPEEAVLYGCKGNTQQNPGAGSNYNQLVCVTSPNCAALCSALSGT